MPSEAVVAEPMQPSRVRLLVHKGSLSEVIVIPEASGMCHADFIIHVRRSARRLTFASQDADHLWVSDCDFPDTFVLLTDFAEQWVDNGRPRKWEVWVVPQCPPNRNGAGPNATPSPGAEAVASHHPTLPSDTSDELRRQHTFGANSIVPNSVSGDFSSQRDDDEIGMSRTATFLHTDTVLPSPSQHGTNTPPTGRVNGNAATVRRPSDLAPALLHANQQHASGVPRPLHQQHRGSGSGGTNLRIFLIRHGESEGNVNKAIYRSVPDHAVSLIERGKQMAVVAGRRLRNTLRSLYGSKAKVGHHVRMFVSPFLRTRQTAENLLKSLNDCEEQWVDTVKESTLLAEQDWGAMEGEGAIAVNKYQEEMERNKIKSKHEGGKFWARQPGGESSFDVCHRISSFFPDILLAANSGTPQRQPVKTVIVVSHGVTIRAFLTMWCRYSPEWFGKSRNPPNCSIALLEDSHDRGYVFGGWEGESDEPIDVAELAGHVDPRMQRWSTILNQAASADPIQPSAEGETCLTVTPPTPIVRSA